MTITLSDIYSPPRIEEIDAELDMFNERLNDYGYVASLGITSWGEALIVVELPSGATTEFINNLDGFRDYWRATEDLISAVEGTES